MKIWRPNYSLGCSLLCLVLSLISSLTVSLALSQCFLVKQHNLWTIRFSPLDKTPRASPPHFFLNLKHHHLPEACAPFSSSRSQPTPPFCSSSLQNQHSLLPTSISSSSTAEQQQQKQQSSNRSSNITTEVVAAETMVQSRNLSRRLGGYWDGSVSGNSRKMLYKKLKKFWKIHDNLKKKCRHQYSCITCPKHIT